MHLNPGLANSAVQYFGGFSDDNEFLNCTQAVVKSSQHVKSEVSWPFNLTNVEPGKICCLKLLSGNVSATFEHLKANFVSLECVQAPRIRFTQEQGHN